MIPGRVEGLGAILAFDLDATENGPAYFILLNFAGAELRFIRNFLYARYAMADACWESLGKINGLLSISRRYLFRVDVFGSVRRRPSICRG